MAASCGKKPLRGANEAGLSQKVGGVVKFSRATRPATGLNIRTAHEKCHQRSIPEDEL